MALTKVTYPDSDNLILGTGNDLYLYHDGSNSYISDLGTGDFKLTTNGAKISLQKGTTETLANFIPDGACELYHDNTKVFETISWGVQIIGGKVTGDFIFDNGSNAGKDITWDESDDALEFADNTKATFGTDTDLEIYHTGSDGVIYNKTGDLFIYGDGDDIFLNATNAKTGVWVKPDAAVELRYDNVKKFETTAAGATVTGTLTADLADDSIDSEHYVDGSIDAAHLSDDAVATAKIQNNAVTSAKIGTNQVTSVEIADDAVGADQLAAGALQTEHCGDNQISEVKLQVSNGPTNGQFLSAQSGNTGGLTWASAGKVLQYVQTTDYTHVTLADNGDNYSQLNTSITCSAAASRVLIIVSLGLVSTDSAADMGWSLLRDTNGWLGVPSSTGATNEATFGAFMNEGSGWAVSSTMAFIDHPNTTNEVTYKVISRANSTRDMVINRRGSDNALRVSSFMQLLELA